MKINKTGQERGGLWRPGAIPLERLTPRRPEGREWGPDLEGAVTVPGSQ